MSYKTKEDAKNYQKKWYNKNKEKRRLINQRFRDNKRKKFTELKKKLKCKNCPENDFRCLDFHHIDPTKKVACVGTLVREASWKKVLEEIKKCEVICSNCHRKFHFSE